MFKTTHNLHFEVAPWPYEQSFMKFRVGTCEGLYTAFPGTYVIVAVTNNEPHNGHLNDVFEWFENSCKREKRNLRVAELMNPKFAIHLSEKRGFKKIKGTNDYEKPLKLMLK